MTRTRFSTHWGTGSPRSLPLVVPGRGPGPSPASLAELCEVTVACHGDMRPSECGPRAWVFVLFLLPQLHHTCDALAVTTSEGSPASAIEPAYRQLQTGGTNTTNETVSACLQAIREESGLEQCEIDYRAADCDGENMISWVTLKGPVIGLYVFGVLMMFLSLSVVCDEFFVPGKVLTYF